jgi:NAD+ diphosphatase
MPRFIPAVVPTGTAVTSRYVHVIGAKVFVSDRLEIEGASSHFIGSMVSSVSETNTTDEAWWAVDVRETDEDPSYGAALDLFSMFARVSEDEWIAAGRAVQIAEWARTHRFCGRCGSPTELQGHERAMKCPACGLLSYPRLAPAMITLVTRGNGDDEEALLAQGIQFRGPMYSCLAGFVEPGETLEGAVVREVREEVGVEVGDVRYQSSQPWPFPHSLMIGFRARWESGDIVCDPTEILDAKWFRRDDLPNIPPKISIARKLIDGWLAGEPG